MSDRQGAITLPALLEQQWRDRTRALAAVVTVGFIRIRISP